MIIRTKTQALRVFKTLTFMGKCMDYHKSTLSKWPEILTLHQSNEVTGAVERYKKRRKK